MTVDLKEHMKNKKREKHIKVYDAIGEAVDGLTFGTALSILSAFTKTVLDNMSEPDRSQAAMLFASIIMESNHKAEDTVQ
jgi:hypothetical protein